LYKYLTAEETLDFFGSLFNLSAKDRRERIDQLLEMVGLDHARRRRVGEFSKGMARRIGLAQAMINDPSFLILDEPTSGLDPLGCREVKDLILTLKRRGKTVLVTSHLLSDVEDVCDRVIILYGGRIRAAGNLNDLLTVGDAQRITVPTLPQAAMEKLLALLRENLRGEEFKIDRPRRTLEEFFLDVIAQARAESVETSGVSGSGGIAEYLAKGDESSAVLNKLLAEEPEVPPQAAVPETATPETAASPQLDERLETLTQEIPEPSEKQAEAEAEKEKRENLSAADAKLNDLLGGKK
jgi:ABC-2 type transport system ATP-binding protein